MALTRSQLLQGNSANGIVLPGTPQGVTQGAGVFIATNGQISVDASTVTGLVKLNNPSAYNAYQWPSNAGTSGQFLQTNGVGILTWADTQGFAVVTVQPQPAPTPPNVGELWFDCTTGTLNVYQNCVGTPSPNWFNVAQPGLPVLPTNTSAAPPFTGGNGTLATPYDCTVTTTGVGTTVYVINTVTVVGLTPFQYVPIVDLNAVTNGGRFTFSNYYANSSGSLTFQTIFNDAPVSASGTIYNAAIKVGYGTAYIDATVNVVSALSVTSGSISGTPQVGSTLTYTRGVASGGTAPYAYTQVWKRNGAVISGATNLTYQLVGADLGASITVEITATDANLTIATATTAPVGPVSTAPFPSATWNPGPAGGLNNIPGLISGPYTGAGPITTTGCIEASVNGGAYSTGTQTITSGQTLAIRWSSSGACGGAATGSPLTGTVSDGVYQNTYNITVNRIPNPAIGDISDSNVALGATTTKAIATAIAGLNTTAYVTYVGTSTGTSIQASTDNVTFTTLATAGTGFPVTDGQTLYIRQTAGGVVSTGYTAIIRVGDGTNTAGTFDEFTYTATTVATAAFPGLTFNNGGAPNAAPDTVTGVTGGGALGTLNGVADSNSWPAGFGTTLSSPGGTPTMKFRVNGGGAYVTSALSVVPTDILNLAWNQAYLDTVADGATATGTITGTVSATAYTNSFTMSVKRSASWTAPTATGAALSTQQTTNALTVNNFNVPVTVSFAAPTSPAVAMTSVVAVVGGVTTNITLGTTTVTLNPGQTFEVLGTTGATGGATYGVAITIGTAAAQDWLVTTSAVPNAIQAPVMSPTGGPLNPALNSPAGITLGGGTYTIATGAPGPHTSSDWELYKAVSYNPTTSAITAVGGFNYDQYVVQSPSYTGGGTLTNQGSLEFSTLAAASNDFNKVFRGPFRTGTMFSAVNTAPYLRFNFAAAGLPNNVPITFTCSSQGGGGWNTIIDTVYTDAGNVTYTPGTPTDPILVTNYRTVSITVPAGATYIEIPGTWSSAAGGGTGGSYQWFGQITWNGVPILTTPTTLTLTNNQDLADMVVGDTVTQDSPYTPTTSAITAVSTSDYSSNFVKDPSFVGTASLSGDWNTSASFIDLSVPRASNPGDVPFARFNFVAAGLTAPATITFDSYQQSGAGWSVVPSTIYTDAGNVTSTFTFSGNIRSNTVSIPAGATYFSLPPSWTSAVGGVANNGMAALVWDGVQILDGATTLTLTDATDLANLQVGDVVRESGSTVQTYSSSLTGATVPGQPAANAFNGLYLESGSTPPTNYGAAGAVSGTMVFTFPPGLSGPVEILCFPIGYAFPLSVVNSSVNGGVATYVPFGWQTIASDASAVTTITLTSDAATNVYLQAIRVNGVVLVDGQYSTQGTITGISTTSPFNLTLNNVLGTWSNGQTAIGPTSTGTGTITGINVAGPTLTLSPSTGTWAANVGKTAIDTTRTIIPPAPTTDPPNATKYTQVVNVANDASNLVTYLVAQSLLTTSSTYYSRARYKASSTSTVSPWANWASFNTASAFVPAPGAALNGGFFGGQINDGGIIYNLIVGPVASAQNGGATPTTIQWKNAASADTPSALWQNQVYGFPASQAGFAGGAATYPALHFARSVSTGGYNDWYLPAKNELEILYFNLKPTTTLNSTSSGINPNAVPTRASNYTAGNPAQTAASDFIGGSGTQAFSTTINYWSSSEESGDPTTAWRQDFGDGGQFGTNKNAPQYARAIRREYANAPVAIGAAFGGGFFAGQYQDGGLTYNLIVAPRASGQYNPSGVNPTGIQYKTTSDADPNPALAQNVVYGEVAQANALAAGQPVGTYPAFEWAGGLTIATLNDWYIPAKNELAILCYNLGPNWTTATAFQGTNTEAFGTANDYWSSSEEAGGTTRAWRQNFFDGNQGSTVKANTINYARAVRRQLA